MQESADHWRDISMFDDQRAVEKIRSDAIDILVDLAGHTAGNRLMVFAARSAPVQITWLGYPATTGLVTMDYRVTDSLADPPGYEAFYTEQLVWVPGCFLCYQPSPQSPPVAPPPAIENGFVTFGSFNNLAKINLEVVTLWSKLLHIVPGSRLLVKNPSLTDPAIARQLMSLLAQHHVSEDRVELLGLAQTTEKHLDAYRHVDVALDTFPYNGTTTTCEALYMGVPVVTLVGYSHAGRVGVSLLTALGLDELVADTPEKYIKVAQKLAENHEKLTDLRNSLRTRMESSQLCDGKAFADKMEHVYRELWQGWCNRVK
jgi:predicted O-linked N-acetylglucosamine transferase (SPINDLY family)